MSWETAGKVKGILCGVHGEKISTTEKLVLLILADYQNDEEGFAWPSVERLAKESLSSERTVQYATQHLMECGLLRIEKVPGGKSKYFVLPTPAVIAPVQPVVLEGCNPAQNPESSSIIIEPEEKQPTVEPPVVPCRACGATGIHRCPGSGLYRRKMHPRSKQREEDSRPAWDPAGFEKFWEAYPLKVGRGEALRAWNENRPEVAKVLVGLKSWINSRPWQKQDGEFIPRARRFITEETWKEDPEPKLRKDLSYGMARIG